MEWAQKNSAREPWEWDWDCPIFCCAAQMHIFSNSSGAFFLLSCSFPFRINLFWRNFFLHLELRFLRSPLPASRWTQWTVIKRQSRGIWGEESNLSSFCTVRGGISAPKSSSNCQREESHSSAKEDKKKGRSHRSECLSWLYRPAKWVEVESLSKNTRVTQSRTNFLWKRANLCPRKRLVSRSSLSFP